MEKLKGSIPLIRFPEFKNNWEHKQLNELLYESKSRNGDLKYSKNQVLSVSGELGIINQIEHLGRSYAGVSVHQYHIVDVGDIVYTKSPLKANPFGIIKLNKGKAGIVSTLYAVYKVNEKTANGDFLNCYFSLDANTNRYLRPLVKKGAKNDMKINNAYVLHDRIFVPTIIEQQKIATFLSVVDEKIQLLKHKKQLLEQYKKGVMQQLFSGKLRFKDENGKAYPKWKDKRLAEHIIDYRLGGNYINTEEITEYPLIKMGNLGRGNINLNKLEYIPIDSVIDPKDEIKYGDLFFNTRNTLDLVGKVSIWRNELPKAYYNSNLLYLKFENNFFMNYYLNSYNAIKALKRFATGTTSVAAIYTKDLLKLELSIPCLEEQKKIADFLSAIDAKIESLSMQINQTQNFKKGLLQQMFV